MKFRKTRSSMTSTESTGTYTASARWETTAPDGEVLIFRNTKNGGGWTAAWEVVTEDGTKITSGGSRKECAEFVARRFEKYGSARLPK